MSQGPPDRAQTLTRRLGTHTRRGSIRGATRRTSRDPVLLPVEFASPRRIRSESKQTTATTGRLRNIPDVIDGALRVAADLVQVDQILQVEPRVVARDQRPGAVVRQLRHLVRGEPYPALGSDAAVLPPVDRAAPAQAAEVGEVHLEGEGEVDVLVLDVVAVGQVGDERRVLVVLQDAVPVGVALV